MLPKNKTPGVALLMTVLVIGAVSVMVLGSLVQTGLSSITLQSFAQDDLAARQRLLSCMDEVLAQFRRSVDFSSSTLFVGDGSCDVSIVSAGTLRTVTLTASEEGIVQHAEFSVDVTTFTVSAFRTF